MPYGSKETMVFTDYSSSAIVFYFLS